MADYPIPGGGVVGQAVEMAKTRYQQRLADLNKQRQGQMRNAGFTADINDQGLLSNMRTDPYNQYGAYQMLNRAQANRFESVQDESIGRGLGVGGGLAAQRMNDARFQSGQEDAQFGSTFQDQLSGLDRMQQDYKYEYDQAMWQAKQEAARSAIQGGEYYPAEGSEYEDPGAGDYPYPEEEAPVEYPPEYLLPIPPSGFRPKVAPKKPAPKKPVTRRPPVASNAARNNARHHGSAPSRPAARPAAKPAARPAARPAAKKPAPKPAARRR